MLLARAAETEPTYSEIGATSSAPPAGYNHLRVSVSLGREPVAWDLAKDALRRWEAHHGAGASIYPPGASLAIGETFLIVVRLGPAFLVAPCRVVSMVEAPTHFDFSYGTLPGHPEQGEERFRLTKSEEGAVNFEIVAFSRPVSFIARLSGRLGRFIQTRTTHRYLDGMRKAVTATAHR